jgi:hypothetical protein
MPLYPLGITRSQDVPPGADEGFGTLTGVLWSRAGELACAFIDAPHDAFKPHRHALTLEAIHRRTCVLPVRFGVELHDEAEIHALLQARSRELLDRLDRLDGACEMGLRITPCNDENTAGKAVGHTTGQTAATYLEQRRSHYRQTDVATERESEVVGQLLGRLQGAYRDWRKLPARPGRAIRLTFLVERERVAAFRRRTEEFFAARRDGRCVVLGPWPPYSFA